MERRTSTLVVWFVCLSSGLTGSIAVGVAHHSLAGVYDTAQRATIEGTVAEFHFVNPHPFIAVDVVSKGSTSRWRLELDNRWELVDVGVTATTWKAGDRIVASGSPGRTQANSLYVRRLDRPADGFWYEQAGSSPSIRPPRSRER